MSKPRDRREYVRISVTLPTHPKLPPGPQAGWLYVVGICWAGEHYTDGVLVLRRVEQAAGVTPRWSQELVAAGLWHPDGHTCGDCVQPGKGKVVIHDYLKHQRSRDEVEKVRESARAAVNRRWHPDTDRSTGRNTDGTADSGTDRTTRSDTNRNTNRNTEGEVEGEKNSLLTLVSDVDFGGSSRVETQDQSSLTYRATHPTTGLGSC